MNDGWCEVVKGLCFCKVDVFLDWVLVKKCLDFGWVFFFKVLEDMLWVVGFGEYGFLDVREDGVFWGVGICDV